MKILMLGWEFPPYNVGGLGVACHGLAKSLVKHGAQVTFVMPKAPMHAQSDFLQLIVADRIKLQQQSQEYIQQVADVLQVKEVPTLLAPYMTASEYEHIHQRLLKKKINKQDITYEQAHQDVSLDDQYGKDLFGEVYRYAHKVSLLSIKEDFDVIHAHDWMTFKAGIAAKQVSGKPLVIHIHNTAYDRSGGNPHGTEYEIEWEGFYHADKIIAISNYVKQSLIKHYAIPEYKIEVAHNGIDVDNYETTPAPKKVNEKMVLFAGRVTLQKGPDYFLHAAKKICDLRDDVKFVIAGNGDMLHSTIELAAQLGIAHKCMFTGRYTKQQGLELMHMADVFVMPSVSEPFGLVPLEAMMQHTPTVISKQSGVVEVLRHTLSVDFWDTHQLASKIAGLLDYKAMHEQISQEGASEVRTLTWDHAAKKCIEVFKQQISNTRTPQALYH
ncbi:MAG: glycosyltransferase family 4 protein [Candidatus Woesearchaeota archaeon]